MGTVLPLHALVVDQAHVRLVDQRGGLEAVAGAFAFHVAVCEATKLRVHDRRQLGERARVAVAPGTEERTDVFPIWITQRSRLAPLCRRREYMRSSLLFCLIAPAQLLRLCR
jgi:hypothetical protein